MANSNMYSELGISIDATESQIQQALTRAAQSGNFSLQKIKKIKNTLLDSKRRHMYDLWIKEQEKRSHDRNQQKDDENKTESQDTAPKKGSVSLEKLARLRGRPVTKHNKTTKTTEATDTPTVVANESAIKTEKSVAKPAEKPATQAVAQDKSAGKDEKSVAQKTVEKHAEKPAEKPVTQAVAQDKSAGKDEKPVAQKTVEKHAEKPAEKPATQAVAQDKSAGKDNLQATNEVVKQEKSEKSFMQVVEKATQSILKEVSDTYENWMKGKGTLPENTHQEHIEPAHEALLDVEKTETKQEEAHEKGQRFGSSLFGGQNDVGEYSEEEMKNFTNMYEELGVANDASQDEIIKKMRLKAEQGLLSLEKLQEIKNTLLDSEKRQEYDKKVEAHKRYLYELEIKKMQDAVSISEITEEQQANINSEQYNKLLSEMKEEQQESEYMDASQFMDDDDVRLNKNAPQLKEIKQYSLKTVIVLGKKTDVFSKKISKKANFITKKAKEALAKIQELDK
ncbi:MAG: hypothetical protein IK065_01390 [Neisseriaceae bacterium]|nr:hypothetical protein [Neisseriaceae bacterium]